MVIQDTQPQVYAWQHLDQIIRAAQTACGGEPRSALLVGAGASHIAHVQDLRALAEARDATLIEVDCRQPGLVSFWSVQRLLEGLGPIVAAEQPDLLRRWGPEIRAIHPDLADALDLHPQQTLDQLALTPAERRSHRESEQAFRIINGVAALVINSQRSCPTLAKGPLLIWWRHLHEADRPSLLTFRRLSRWINQMRAPIVLIGSLDPAGGPVFDLPPLQPDVQRYHDWRAAHGRLLQAVRDQSLGLELEIQESDLPAEERPTFAPIGDVPINLLNGPRSMLLAYEKLQQDQFESAAVYLLHSMRLAVFALNIEAIMLLGHLALAYIAPLDDAQFDDARFAEDWQRLTAEEHYAALEFATSSMQGRQDIVMAVWKAAALAQTFLEHHEAASECYQRALELAPRPAMRAQLCMYLGLMSGKRLRDIQQAEAYLQQGFDEIAGQEDPEALLEHGWLSNVSALLTYQQGRHRDAMSFLRGGLAAIKPLHIYEATYLKINVVSNMSVLLEETKQSAQALEIWTFFRNFLNTASESFGKHYFFREGGLRLCAAERAAALDCYRQSYEHSRSAADEFHMEIAARAAGYVCYGLDDFAAAQGWFAESAHLRRQLGDYENLPEPLVAQALCYHRLNQGAETAALLAEAEGLCRDIQLNWLAKVQQAQGLLGQGGSDALAAWEQLALRAPSTKLNRPFYLINLYR